MKDQWLQSPGKAGYERHNEDCRVDHVVSGFRCTHDDPVQGGEAGTVLVLLVIVP